MTPVELGEIDTKVRKLNSKTYFLGIRTGNNRGNNMGNLEK